MLSCPCGRSHVVCLQVRHISSDCNPPVAKASHWITSRFRWDREVQFQHWVAVDDA